MTRSPLPASKRSGVAPFIVMDVMRDANRLEAAGKDIMHLEVGQPGAQIPASVWQAAAAGMEAGPLAYTDALGLPSLRQRIARHYADAYGLEISAERVVVTAGSSAAFILTFLACFDEGARVGLPEPGYPAYRNILSAFGITPVGIPVSAETGWNLTPDLIAEAEQATGALDGILVASPNNPTGTMLDRPALLDLTKNCGDNGRWFISDEIYHRISYGTGDVTALEVDPHAIVINSFSKYYCMTGWRLGWCIVPDELVRPIERLAQNLFISPPTASQIAAERAFDASDEFDANVETYAANRALLLAELPKAGFTTFAPADGAFYLYADVSHLTEDSAALCQELLNEAGVAVTPGIDFDPVRGNRYVRFSFAGKTADMAEAARRLQVWSDSRTAG